MYTDLLIEDLYETSESTKNRSTDLLLNSNNIRFYTALNEDGIRIHKLKIANGMDFDGYYGASKWACSQICSSLLIGANYWKHMATNMPELLQINVNSGFIYRKRPQLIRTLDGGARAFLSERYSFLENHDVLLMVFDALSKLNVQFEVASASCVDSKMFLKIVFPSIQKAVKVGDTVQAGIMVTNCEVGTASTNIQMFVERLVCTNGMVVSQREHSTTIKFHKGPVMSTLGKVDNNCHDRNLISSKVFNAIRQYSDMNKFSELVERMSESVKDVIKGDPEAVVEAICDLYFMTYAEKDIIATRLLNHEGIKEGMNRWALVNAITEASKNSSSYTRATEIERIGGDVLFMGRNTWAKISDMSKKDTEDKTIAMPLT